MIVHSWIPDNVTLGQSTEGNFCHEVSDGQIITINMVKCDA